MVSLFCNIKIFPEEIFCKLKDIGSRKKAILARDRVYFTSYNETPSNKGESMPCKYAVRITNENYALVRVLSHFSEEAIRVKEGKTYFLFTVDSPTSTTDHDVVAEDDLYNYDGCSKESRITLL